jgi:hypothetical protein
MDNTVKWLSYKLDPGRKASEHKPGTSLAGLREIFRQGAVLVSHLANKWALYHKVCLISNKLLKNV